MDVGVERHEEAGVAATDFEVFQEARRRFFASLQTASVLYNLEAAWNDPCYSSAPVGEQGSSFG